MRNLLRFSALLAISCTPALLVACGSDATGNNGVGASSSAGATSDAAGYAGQTPTAGGAPGTAGGQTASGAPGTAGGAPGSAGGAPGSAGAQTAGGAPGSAGSGAAGGGSVTKAGNPDGSCSAGVPAAGKAVDVSSPTTVVGTGTSASCTFAALDAAVSKGGIITFDCGSDPVAIAITATLNVPITKNTVLDGGGKITLDGKSALQIMRFDSPNFRATDFGLTLQHITLANGKTTPKEAIPTAPAPCSQGFNDGEGGAVYVRDGALTIIDSIFTNNQAASLGPDTGGGGVYIVGSKRGAVIVGSTFTGNSASNGGGVAAEFAELDIYNSLFTNNKATGHDANNNEPAKCSAMNNGQNETGSGGNGGPIYSDGNGLGITLCGDKITGNAAGMNAFGGGLFFTSNDFGGALSIADTTMTGNTGGSWTSVKSGTVMNVGTGVGTNCKSITVTNSTLQGYP